MQTESIIPAAHRLERRIGWGSGRFARARLLPERKKDAWELMYDRLLEFRQQHGHACVPVCYAADRKLGRWVQHQRKTAKNGTLWAERRWRLQRAEFVFEVRKAPPTGTVPRIGWEGMYERLAAFHARHGHTRVPVRYNEDPKLGRWVSAQRQMHTLGDLSLERQERLQQIGFLFDPLDAAWEESSAALEKFAREQGHCAVPCGWTDAPRLYYWIHYQRIAHRQGSLPQDRARRLEAIGFHWEQMCPKWVRAYFQLKEFRKQHGHCRVPCSTRLGAWIATQRRWRAKGKLTPEQIELLDALELRWHRAYNSNAEQERRWQEKLRAVAAFKREHGRWPPQRLGDPGINSLHQWLVGMRMLYHRGKLPPDRVRALEAIGFTWRHQDPRWDSQLAALAEFKAAHGHCNVPKTWPANPALGSFVNWTRHLRAKRTLSDDCIRQLDAMGFVWDPMELKWQEMCGKLAAFRAEHGHNRVTHTRAHNLLALFVARVRERKAAGRLSAQKVAQLNALGFDW